VSQDATTDHYELTQRTGLVDILPDGPTEVWGYDGIFPGPTIESRSGRRTVVTHRNELPVPTVVHLHGGKTPPEHDGYPTDLVTPAGESLSDHGHTDHGEPIAEGEYAYEYPLEQPAAVHDAVGAPYLLLHRPYQEAPHIRPVTVVQLRCRRHSSASHRCAGRPR
jgi:spore coat protein A